MNRVWLGALLGVTVGVADVLLMLPMQFQDPHGGTPWRLLRALRPRVFRGNRAIAVAAHLGWHRRRTPDQHAGRDLLRRLTRRFSARGYFSARSVVGRSDGGVSRLHDVAEVMR